ncbi:MAG: hypothetical protein ACXAAP_13105 [Candidatus Thorarchaeota archaeon]
MSTISAEEEAYAEVLANLFGNGVMWEIITNTCYIQQPPENPGDPPPPPELVDKPVTLAGRVAGLLQIHGWWYLIFKTCSAEGAKMVARWCKEKFPNKANFVNKYKFPVGDEAEKEKQNKKFRNDFQLFLREQDAWWEAGFGGIAASGIGPWPKTNGTD